MSIFSEYAPFYYAKGMPVIPLVARDKRPYPNGWSDYSNHPVPEEIQKQWLASPSEHNIGLVLGEQSGVGALDIDYADADLTEAILGLLPKGYDVWKRVGAKGMVLAFKFNPKVPKAFKVIDKTKGTLVEYLCTGQQIVLPPSIHPTTQKPYVANSNLYEVLDKLVMIPDDLEEKIRSLCELKGYEISSTGVGSLIDFIPAGFRDSSITQKAGLLAHEIVAGKITLKAAINLLYGVENYFTQQIEGDPMDMDKHVNNLLKFVKRDLNRQKIALPQGWSEGLTADEIKQIGFDTIAAESSYEEILDYYNLEADNCPDSEQQLKLMDDAILKLAQINKADRVRETFVLNKIVEKSGLPVRMGDLRTQLINIRNSVEKTVMVGADDEGKGGTEIELNTHTEIALAVKDMLETMHPICVEAGSLYKYMGSHWVMYETDLVKQFIALNFSKLEMMKRNSDVEGVYRQLMILCDKTMDKNNTHYVNVANGVVLENSNVRLLRDKDALDAQIEKIRAAVLMNPNAESGMWTPEEISEAQENSVKVFLDGLSEPTSFVGHDQSYGATYVLPYRYLPEQAGKMPLFDSFLNDCWGHRSDYEQMRNQLQEALYVSFMGQATKYQRAFLLYGLAQSGKSVLLGIISSLFPEEAKTAISFDRMSENRYLVSINRKNVNIVGELSERKLVEGDIFKSIVDGTAVTVYQLYKESFSMKSVAAHWAASNHLPKTRDSSEGFTRRWLFFHFDKQIPDENIDVDLSKKIISQEREAIFAWALAAAPRMLSQRGFTTSRSHNVLMAQLACQTNPALFFILKDPNLEIKKNMGPERQGEMFEVTEFDLHVQFRAFLRVGVGSRRVIEMQEFRHMLDEIIASRGIKRFSKPNDINQWYSGIRVKKVG